MRTWFGRPLFWLRVPGDWYADRLHPVRALVAGGTLLIILIVGGSAAFLADWPGEGAIVGILDLVTVSAVGGALYFGARWLDRTLRKAHEQLEQAVELLPEGVILFDRNDRLVVSNSAARNLHAVCADHLPRGASFESFLRKNAASGIYVGVDGDVDSWISRRVAEYRAGAGTVREIQLTNGRWLRAEDRRMPDGSTVCLRVDITELKAREASFRLMFDDNPVPMWLYDRESLRFIEVNTAAVEHYGYSRDRFLAMRVTDIRPPQDVEPLHQAIVAECGARIRRGMWRHRRADGSLIDAEIIGSRMNFRGYDAELIAAFDVTERNAALAAAHTARDAAEAANRMKSQFLATMSHELRTPLNAILGFSEIIEHAVMGPIDRKYQGYAANIHSSGEHLLRLINDILDLSKIEAGKAELYEERVDMVELVDSCRRLIADRAATQQVALECTASRDLPAVHGDKLRLKQVLLNILSNAVKFTAAGGRVMLTASAPAGDGFVVRVADTGIGMRPEQIPMALEAFRQLDDALNRRHDGTGLGLPIADKLTRLHGGTLTIDSMPGRGTTVSIRLPESRVLRAPAAPAIVTV